MEKKHKFKVFRIKKSSRQVLLEGTFTTKRITELQLKKLIKKELKEFSSDGKYDVAYSKEQA